jgi:hypothetical protein
VEKETPITSQDGKWRSFPRVPHLLQNTSSGAYFARIEIKGKLICQSLEMTSEHRIECGELSWGLADQLLLKRSTGFS